ncbi:nicotinate phosphoribosyltransferase [Candidatus Thorarchaeota archaeon]|nr:MAG: nicotinate phosphoribosyltransferase [Candidatus Thorarchaeota archaeon]
MKRRWRIATEEEIREGKTTDVYFDRTVEVLKAESVNPMVHAEVTVSEMPDDLEWGIMAGVDDMLKLFEGRAVDVYGLPEGTLFYPRGSHSVRTPVIAIEGHYQEFAALETPMLGFICHSSGMASKTAHLRLAAGDKTLLSFGARRTHPAITPQVSYAAYLGGCDGVSCVLGGELIGIEAQGTMPHALIIAFQDHVKAWNAFSDTVPENIARIALTDTYLDEVKESVLAAAEMKGIDGVRLDTPGSRRGDFKEIIEEVRWELDARGFHDVSIFVSGGLDAEEIRWLNESPVNGYGVGGAISNSPAVDFAMDIVSLKEGANWAPCAKRGKFSGRKFVWQCPSCMMTEVTLRTGDQPDCPQCGKSMNQVTQTLMKQGKILQEPKPVKELREYVIQQITILKRE